MCSQPPCHLVGFASSGDVAEPNDGLAVLESLVENDVGVAFNCLLLVFWSFVVLLQLLPFNGLQSLGRRARKKTYRADGFSHSMKLHHFYRHPIFT